LSENSRGYFNLGLIYVAKKESGAAAEAFSRSLEMNPNNYRAQMFYASALEELGDETGAKKANSKALEIIRGLVEINPNNPYQLSNGATILASLGEKTEAIDWAERARSVNQSDVKAQFNIGVTYLTVGQTEKGIEELVAALDMGYPRELFVVSDVPEAIFEDPRIAQRLESVD
jgi:tetratricopeptide (TPR) repeat protein